jgi:hypothetical protein
LGLFHDSIKNCYKSKLKLNLTIVKKSAFFILCFVLIASFSSYAQKNESDRPRGQIGITFSSFGDNPVIRFQSLTGDASYDGDKFYTFGINYLYKLNHTFDIETGIEYSKQKIIIRPNLPPQMDNSPRGANLSLVNLPVTIRMNFLRYCFINAGMLVDIDATSSSPVDSQNGIGAIGGFGIKYDFNSGFSVFANPYLKMHAMIPFSSETYPQRLMESGFRFGLMFTL